MFFVLSMFMLIYLIVHLDKSIIVTRLKVYISSLQIILSTLCRKYIFIYSNL